MKILKRWDNLKKGHLFGAPTWYSDFHLGVDHIVGCGTSIYMPFTGRVLKTYGKQGGHTIFVYPDERNEMIRILHCEWVTNSGRYDAGAIIGRVGSTGLSTGCHTHCDISKSGTLDLSKAGRSNFTDPLKYNWEDKMSDEDKKMLIVEILNRQPQGDWEYKGRDLKDLVLQIGREFDQRLASATKVEIKEVVKEVIKIVEKEVPVEVIKEIERMLTPKEEEKIAKTWLWRQIEYIISKFKKG